jgi:sulfite reductase (NADPH) flavoprotein alpha-component
MNTVYHRSHPFMAKIIERTLLCREGSLKETYHLVLDLKGSGISYEVGDCLAVLPSNSSAKVKRLLEVLGFKGSEPIVDRRSGDQSSIQEFLTQKANLNDCPLSLVKKMLESCVNPVQRSYFQELAEDKMRLKQLDLLELLTGGDQISIDPQELADELRPMMPRFYSIASSMKTVGEEVHLTVAVGKCETLNGDRPGVCTDYLCHQVSLHSSEVPVYIHPHRGFTLPKDRAVSVIMVGPGTGVAPFRGFMQEREHDAGAGKNWLFFGEWHLAQQFFYQEYWESLVRKQILQLDLAFSRDQADKIYVQDRMKEKGAELFDWLQKGAFLYICGDASRMAKDVDSALHDILQLHGGFTEMEAKSYVKQMRADKRYLRDVY